MRGLQLDAAADQHPPLQAILLFVVLVGICDGVAQGAIFGDVALLPPKYTQVISNPCLAHLSCGIAAAMLPALVC